MSEAAWAKSLEDKGGGVPWRALGKGIPGWGWEGSWRRKEETIQSFPEVHLEVSGRCERTVASRGIYFPQGFLSPSTVATASAWSHSFLFTWVNMWCNWKLKKSRGARLSILALPQSWTPDSGSDCFTFNMKESVSKRLPESWPWFRVDLPMVAQDCMQCKN